MPGFTYLTGNESVNWASVPNDKDCDELLQELRQKTGEEWLIQVVARTVTPTFLGRFIGEQVKHLYYYTLYCYAGAGFEYQVINVNTETGGSNFSRSSNSRQNVMNYMLGFIAGIYHSDRKTQTNITKNT